MSADTPNAPPSSDTPGAPPPLAALEQAFARAPTSEAWRPLAEAYLAAGRHLEATVVAKKAARSRPEDPAPRVLAVRVLAAQGKGEKAREEAAAVAKAFPASAEAGALARELGAIPAATAAAIATGTSTSASASTSTATRTATATRTSAASGTGTATRTSTAAPTSTATGTATATASRTGTGTGTGTATGTATGTGAATRTSTAAQAAAARRPPHLDPAYAQDLARRFGEAEGEPGPARRAHARTALLRTAALAGGLAVALAAIAAVAASRRAEQAEVERLLGEARPLLEKDTWGSLRDAADRCERAAAIDGASAEARACAAFAGAARFADHGEGDPPRDAARRHLAALGAAGPARAAAAGALLKVAEGDARAAAEALWPRAASEGSPVLHAALGEALLAQGDLDGARDALSTAQRLAPGDVRAVRLLAELYRRRGGADAAQAEVLQEIALARLAPDHPAVLLGKARLLLDRKAHAEALAVAERVAAMSQAASPRQRAIAHAVRARALALAGRKDEAVAAERAALGLDAQGREVREILGPRVAAAG